jgi:hypothetical protein
VSPTTTPSVACAAPADRTISIAAAVRFIHTALVFL